MTEFFKGLGLGYFILACTVYTWPKHVSGTSEADLPLSAQACVCDTNITLLSAVSRSRSSEFLPAPLSFPLHALALRSRTVRPTWTHASCRGPVPVLVTVVSPLPAPGSGTAYRRICGGQTLSLANSVDY